MKKNIKTQKVPNVNELVSAEQRGVLEEQAKELSEKTQMALATQSDLRIEKVKANTHTGEREVIRAQNGKFVKAATFAASLDARASQQFLKEIDPDTGKSRKHSIREAL